MAEAVAAAASVAGLASLTIQLTEGVAKLRRFYRSVRNAPETLNELVTELETLTLALREVERDVQRSDGNVIGPSALMEQCVKSCQRGTAKLQAVLDKMTRLQVRSRGLGQVYIAVNEKDEQVILSDLERAKSSLALAFQIYTESVDRLMQHRC